MRIALYYIVLMISSFSRAKAKLEEFFRKKHKDGFLASEYIAFLRHDTTKSPFSQSKWRKRGSMSVQIALTKSVSFAMDRVALLRWIEVITWTSDAME